MFSFPLTPNVFYNDANQTHFHYHPILGKIKYGKFRTWNSKGIKKASRNSESIKKEVDFVGDDQEKVIWIFYWSWIFGLGISKRCSTNLWNFQG